MNIIIKDCVVLPMDGGDEQYFEGAVAVSGRRIVGIYRGGLSAAQLEQFERRYGGGIEMIDGRGKLVMPGLVNTHNHVAMTFMRGYADDMPLMEWLQERIWPLEARLSAQDIGLGAELGIAEMLLGGTTTFCDMYWHEAEIARAVERSGIRAVLSPAYTDRMMEEFREDFALLAERYAGPGDSRISLMVAPHSTYTCSRENLLFGRRLAEEHGLGIHIHVSETLSEQQTIAAQTGMTPIKYLDGLGMLGPSTLVVHAVQVDDADMEIMQQRGVSVAYNPQSNMKLASGIAPVEAMLRVGINVGIGTDGPSSNNDLDMWEELRTASLLQKVASTDPRSIPAYRALEMATADGARALGLGDRTGRLKEGMLADIIMLDIEKPHLYPHNDLVANLAYCAKSSDVEMVVIDGEIVVRGGKTLHIDSLDACRRVQKRMEELIG